MTSHTRPANLRDITLDICILAVRANVDQRETRSLAFRLDSHDVLVLVMAAGVNYNGVWAGLGTPISPFDVHKAPFHIAGSDAAGIVWACGSKVRRWKVGDAVIVHCNQDDGDDEDCNGGDLPREQRQLCGDIHGDFDVRLRSLLPQPRPLQDSST